MVQRTNDPGEQPNDSSTERHTGDRDYFPLIPRSDALSGVVLIVQADEELRHFDPPQQRSRICFGWPPSKSVLGASQFGRRAVRRWGPNRGRMWLDAELDSEDGLELVDRVRFRKKRRVLDEECLHSVGEGMA